MNEIDYSKKRYCECKNPIIEDQRAIGLGEMCIKCAHPPKPLLDLTAKIPSSNR